jgi:hypothetical protein
MYLTPTLSNIPQLILVIVVGKTAKVILLRVICVEGSSERGKDDLK